MQTLILLKNITVFLGLLHWKGNSRNCFQLWMHWPSKCNSGIKEARNTSHCWGQTKAASWNMICTQLSNRCRHLCQVPVSVVHEYELPLTCEVYHTDNIFFLTGNEKWLHITVQAKTSISTVQQFRLGLFMHNKEDEKVLFLVFGQIYNNAWSDSLVVCRHFCFTLGLRGASKNRF